MGMGGEWDLFLLTCACGHRSLGVAPHDALAVCPDCPDGLVKMEYLSHDEITDEMMKLPYIIHRIGVTAEAPGNWIHSPHVKCRLCGHSWGSCYPNGTDTDNLECPNCHNMSGEAQDKDDSQDVPHDLRFLNDLPKL